MASKTFLPLGTGQYQAEKARLSKDIDLQGAINSEVAALGLEFDIADDYADDAAAAAPWPRHRGSVEELAVDVRPDARRREPRGGA